MKTVGEDREISPVANHRDLLFHNFPLRSRFGGMAFVRTFMQSYFSHHVLPGCKKSAPRPHESIESNEKLVESHLKEVI